MTEDKAIKIVDLFQVPSKRWKKTVLKLVLESFLVLGQEQSLNLLEEWLILSEKMCKIAQLRSLGDKNHRLLLIQFIKYKSMRLYKNSYYNNAKISADYIKYLKELGPYYFTEILIIVQKLKVIKKHYHKMKKSIISENHIDIKIQRLLNMCNSKQKKINNNTKKFHAIVEVEQDRQDLTLKLGKMLRKAWAIEKNKPNFEQFEDQLMMQVYSSQSYSNSPYSSSNLFGLNSREYDSIN